MREQVPAQSNLLRHCEERSDEAIYSKSVILSVICFDSAQHRLKLTNLIKVPEQTKCVEGRSRMDPVKLLEWEKNNWILRYAQNDGDAA